MDLKSLDKSCRLCFSECGADSVNIFDETLSGPTYSAQVKEMFQIELLETLNWPTSACTNCVAQLEEVRRLRISITTAQSLIGEALQNVSIKTERANQLKEDGDVPIELWCSPEWIEDEAVDSQTTKEEDENMIEEVDYKEEGKSKSGEDDEHSNSSADDEDMEYQPGTDSEDNDTEKEDMSEDSSSTKSPLDKQASKSICRYKKLLYTEKTKRIVARSNAKKTDEIRELEELMRSKGLLACKICHLEQKTYLELWSHVRHFHKKEASNYTFCCTRTITSSSVIFDHMRVHRNPDTFKCRFCHVGQQSASALKSHERNVHENGEIVQPKKRRRKYSPLSPKEVEKALQKLQRKKRSGKDDRNETFKPLLQDLSLLVCPDCKQEHLHIVDLWIHHLEVHKQAAVFECCNKKFFQIKTVYGHMRYHQDPQSIEFKCEICQAQFKTKIQKRVHLSDAHPDNGQLVCDICGLSFANKGSLKGHKLRHLPNDERPHKCTECGKGFILACLLQTHIDFTHKPRDETQASSFICDQCGKTYPTRHKLRCHSYTHNKEYKAKYNAKNNALVPCVQCGKLFRRMFVKTHQMKYCKGSIAVDYKCHICGKEYNRQQSLSCHITHKHFPKNHPKQKEKKAE